MQQARIEAGDLCGSQAQRLCGATALDPVIGCQLRIADRKWGRLLHMNGMCCRSRTAGQAGDQQQQRQQAARQWHERLLMDVATDEVLCERPMLQAHSAPATSAMDCSVRVAHAAVPTALVAWCRGADLVACCYWLYSCRQACQCR